MVFPFKLRVYKQHEDREADGWLRFDFVFDVREIQITAFEEHVLFDNDSNPTKCVQIFFSDGDSVYGCYSMDKFIEIYNSDYKDVFAEYATNKMIMDGALDDEEQKKKKWWMFWK